MNWKKERLKNFKLYAITDLKKIDGQIVNQVERILAGGADVIQLRAKDFSDLELIELGSKIKKLTNRMKKLFIVNDRVDLALAIGADGVHLGQDDLPIREARKIAGKKLIIGRSTHSLKQATQAEKEGADYIGFGPIYGTPTKPTYKPIGPKLIQTMMRKIRIPAVCIGGIDEFNINEVLFNGAKRVAVVRALFSSKHPYQSAQKLKRLINNANAN